MKQIGIIGMGNMGMAMVEKYLEAGYQVLVYDINMEAVKKAITIGAIGEKAPKHVSEKAGLVLIILPGPAQVKDVLTSKNGIFAGYSTGDCIVDMSTVDPFSTQKNAEKAKERGFDYLDAPVLGRPHGCGNWTLPIGGEKQVLARIKEDLDVIAKNIVYIGSSGSGNVLKLLNNMMFGAINTVTSEIMAISAKLGLNPKVLFETIAGSGAATVSNLFLELGPKILERNFEPKFSVELLHKDMALGIEMAKKAAAPLFISEVNQKVNEIALFKGLGSEDSSSIVKVYEDLSGVKVDI
ncbi:MAG: NAD(P)-dependent oxidoreductase [Halanaerobiales bacterium]|nr:NAD(P)-dependent oxidoreductase [Halanaerobiales bacterium]